MLMMIYECRIFILEAAVMLYLKKNICILIPRNIDQSVFWGYFFVIIDGTFSESLIKEKIWTFFCFLFFILFIRYKFTKDAEFLSFYGSPQRRNIRRLTKDW